jgi:hypothetical protein
MSSQGVMSSIRPVTTLDCILQKNSSLILQQDYGLMITSWACLLVLVTICHVICWLTIQHFGLYYILLQDPQGWHWSSKLVQRTLLCKLTGNFISTYSIMSGYQESPKEWWIVPGNFITKWLYHVLPALKQMLGSHKSKNDCELKQLWHNGWQHRTWISTGNRRACFTVWCLRCSQAYMEKQCDTSTIKSALFLSQPTVNWFSNWTLYIKKHSLYPFVISFCNHKIDELVSLPT